MTALARTPIVTRAIPPHRGAIEAQAQVWQNALPNLLQTTATATVFRLPLTFRREPPNPYAAITAEAGVWQNPLMLLLKSKDQFFDAAGMGPDYDWPNPRGYPFPMEGRGFTDGLDLDTLAAAKPAFSLLDQPNPILARDRWGNAVRSFGDSWQNFTPVIPTATTMRPATVFRREPTNPMVAIRAQDWVWTNENPFRSLAPVVPIGSQEFTLPRGYGFPLENRTFINPIDLQLIGQDKIYGAPGQGVPNYDQPNPRGYAYPVGLRTAITPDALALILAPPAINPFFLLVCSNPSPPPIPWAAIRAQSDMQSMGPILFPRGLTPFNLLDQPNPRGYIYPSGNRTFINTPPFQIPSVFIQGQNFDWPVPRGYAYPTSLRTWIDTLKQGLTSAVFVPPDLTNPRGYPFPIADRGFVQGLNLNLTDTFYGLGGPTYDWPNPRGYPFPVNLRTWLQNNIAGPLPPAPPFFMTDWPNPRGYAFPMIVMPPTGLPTVRFPHLCPGLIWLPGERSKQNWLRSEICIPGPM